MNKIARFVLVCSILAALAAPALAHHSAAAYDTQKEVTVTGTVSQYRFGNPHVYMTLQVKKADGSTGAVEVEAGAASVLNPLGFKKDSVAAGDVVTVIGNPGRKDRKSTRLNSSHTVISYAVFCLKKKIDITIISISTLASMN